MSDIGPPSTAARTSTHEIPREHFSRTISLEQDERGDFVLLK